MSAQGRGEPLAGLLPPVLGRLPAQEPRADATPDVALPDSEIGGPLLPSLKPT